MGEHKHSGWGGVWLRLVLILTSHGDIGAPDQSVLFVSFPSLSHHFEHPLANQAIALLGHPVHKQVPQGVYTAYDDLGSMVGEPKIFHRSTHSLDQETFLSDSIDNPDYSSVLWSRDRVRNVVSTDMHSNQLKISPCQLQLCDNVNYT